VQIYNIIFVFKTIIRGYIISKLGNFTTFAVSIFKMNFN